MPPLARRAVASLLILTAGFLAGTTFDALHPRPARAQSVATSTIYVPEGGLVFRAADGTPIARLSHDAHGGTFELFDSHQQPELRPNPYDVDDDPFTTRKEPRPGPGF